MEKMSEWGGGGEGFLVPHPSPHQPSPVKYLITIQDGGIESLIYLPFRSKITAALQATQYTYGCLLVIILTYKYIKHKEKCFIMFFPLIYILVFPSHQKPTFEFDLICCDSV